MWESYFPELELNRLRLQCPEHQGSPSGTRLSHSTDWEKQEVGRINHEATQTVTGRDRMEPHQASSQDRTVNRLTTPTCSQNPEGDLG